MTNDDGFSSKGLEFLHNVLCPEYDVFIVAPDVEQSGVGHSFTYQNTLRIKKHDEGYAENLFSLNGSPADCVKFAISKMLPEFPDLIVSGMNFGENSGISSYYSGTVAGAREGAFWRIRSFAFSLCSEAREYAENYSRFVPEIVALFDDPSVISDKTVYFNVNFPPADPGKIRGIKVTRQSMAYFYDDYEIVNGGPDVEYRIFGEKVNIEESSEFDSRALLENWITVTPHTFDSTSYESYSSLKKLETVFSIKGEKYV